MAQISEQAGKLELQVRRTANIHPPGLMAVQMAWAISSACSSAALKKTRVNLLNLYGPVHRRKDNSNVLVFKLLEQSGDIIAVALETHDVFINGATRNHLEEVVDIAMSLSQPGLHIRLAIF